MTRATNSIATRAVDAVRRLVDRAFERLERAQLNDIERSLAGARNARELSQRLHRLEAGEVPLA